MLSTNAGARRSLERAQPRPRRWTAQFLGDRLHVAGGNALDVHLSQRRNHRLLGSPVPLENSDENRPFRSRGTRSSGLPTPCNQRPVVVPRSIAGLPVGSLALRCGECPGHLAFENLLQQILHGPARHVVVRTHHVFDGRDRWLNPVPGRGGAPVPLVTSNITSLP